MGRDWPGFEVLDTVRLARHLMATPQEVPDRKLATLASFFGTPVRPSHRALDDARATAVVLGELLGRLADREGVMTLDELDAWLAARDAEAAARHAEATASNGDAASARPGWLAAAARATPLRLGRLARTSGYGSFPGATPTDATSRRSFGRAGGHTIAVCCDQPAGADIGRPPGGEQRHPVVTAIVLLKAEIHRIPEVAEAIAQLPAVSEVYSITGDYDLVAIIRVRAHDDLADVIPGGLNKVTASPRRRRTSRSARIPATTLRPRSRSLNYAALVRGTPPCTPRAWRGLAPP